MSFIKFTETARSYKPRVSIRQNGTIGFNHGAVKKWNLQTFDYALLFFDRESRSIGIRPVKSEEEGALKLHHGKGNKSAWVSSRKFFDYFELDAKATRKFDPVWDEVEKMIVVKFQG